MRLRVIVAASALLLGLAPSDGGAEAFSSYWSTLSSTERDFVDNVAADIYGEEYGGRAGAYVRLNSATKARFRARAIEALGVENRPSRVNRKGVDI
ncbi:MAG: hypothetical protein KDD85_05295 [Parvularculaceae bacterium]|nr:hypothetical protein [Parvularculaceae bacterium]